VESTHDVQNLAAAAGATVVPGLIDYHSDPSAAGLDTLEKID
jgi:imidazolonepropionase-like amidohydrolase|tara:strand:- start:356 stop:481 length:126 start_codon:yes stop_codon:yes gene_type:complete